MRPYISKNTKVHEEKVNPNDLEMGYREIAEDAEHEREAQEWCEGFVGDAFDE